MTDRVPGQSLVRDGNRRPRGWTGWCRALAGSVLQEASSNVALSWPADTDPGDNSFPKGSLIRRRLLEATGYCPVYQGRTTTYSSQ